MHGSRRIVVVCLHSIMFHSMGLSSALKSTFKRYSMKLVDGNVCNRFIFYNEVKVLNFTIVLNLW